MYIEHREPDDTADRNPPERIRDRPERKSVGRGRRWRRRAKVPMKVNHSKRREKYVECDGTKGEELKRCSFQKHAGAYSTAKVEPVEASESGDHFSTYAQPSTSKVSPSMKLTNFNLFDSMNGIYDPAVATINANPSNSTALTKATHLHHSMVNGTHQQPHHPHGGQTMYPSNVDYSSTSVNNCNGYWPYPSQSFLPGSTRQYIVPPTSSVADVCSPPPRPDLNYPNHVSYGPMQKMVGSYPTSYEFYPSHNAKYC